VLEIPDLPGDRVEEPVGGDPVPEISPTGTGASFAKASRQRGRARRPPLFLMTVGLISARRFSPPRSAARNRAKPRPSIGDPRFLREWAQLHYRIGTDDKESFPRENDGRARRGGGGAAPLPLACRDPFLLDVLTTGFLLAAFAGRGTSWRRGGTGVPLPRAVLRHRHVRLCDADHAPPLADPPRGARGRPPAGLGGIAVGALAAPLRARSSRSSRSPSGRPPTNWRWAMFSWRGPKGTPGEAREASP